LSSPSFLIPLPNTNRECDALLLTGGSIFEAIIVYLVVTPLFRRSTTNLLVKAPMFFLAILVAVVDLLTAGTTHWRGLMTTETIAATQVFQRERNRTAVDTITNSPDRREQFRITPQ